jgi:hypothetical protein
MVQSEETKQTSELDSEVDVGIVRPKVSNKYDYNAKR